ncbi:mitochondrial fission ELM1 family protein [Pelagibius marinus]|uniref:mitochondrial fission ELM1 family protein n=1 Tax=Pelagibius marinus TaxID=2762760 RepID=UPI0018723050|nr:ELM1/GtrOC1 family putative glycosyltransferase [Pelagibius marinus]
MVSHPDQDSPPVVTPRLWLLLDDRPGHTTQAVGLAEALGWPYETRELRFTLLNRLSNRLLGASRLSLDAGRSDALTPPWPDLVIAMGRRTAPIARWIKRQSGGHSKLVQLGRKAANVAADFDLSVTCAHFQQPAHPKRVELLLPPTQVTPARLQAAAARWPDLFDGAARPRVALLVGGTTAHHRLTAETAARMAGEVQAFAAALGGSLTCVTSRRSGAAVEQALKEGAPAATMHFWRRDQQENPYLGYLAQADILVVTGESESMLAEAAGAAKPLYIYPIPAKPESLRARLAAGVLRASQDHGPLARLCEGLIQRGLVVPPRDLELMHRGMIAAGIARPFGDGRPPAGGLPPLRQDALTERVRLLLEGR